MKFIKTENGELLNLANVIGISLAEGECDSTPRSSSENRNTVTMFGLIATDIIGKEHTLALYGTQEQSEAVFAEICGLIELDKLTVLEMPEDTGLTSAAEG